MSHHPDCGSAAASPPHEEGRIHGAESLSCKSALGNSPEGHGETCDRVFRRYAAHASPNAPPQPAAVAMLFRRYRGCVELPASGYAAGLRTMEASFGPRRVILNPFFVSWFRMPVSPA